MRAAPLLAVVALALAGCETTAEKSAKLERQALRGNSGALKAKGLSIAHASTVVKVLDSQLVHGSEGAAVAITLRNTSAHPIANIPLEIAVEDSHGATLYSNTSPGLAHSLTAAPLIEAHGESTWIDDQVTGASGASRVTATVGEGTSVTGSVPRLTVAGAHLLQEAGSAATAAGTIANHSSSEQQELVVYALARRAGKVVAAGRAVLAQVPAGASVPFQAFFVGNPAGAQLQISAPPSTLR